MTVKLLSDVAIYHDGMHNMVPRLVTWGGRLWLAFRNGSGHRSPDGRIMVTSTSDLVQWSLPKAVIDSSLDDRDPAIFVSEGRLHVTSLSVKREPDGRAAGVPLVPRECRCLLSTTADGISWSSPVQALPSNHAIWWPVEVGETVYAAVQRRIPQFPDPDSVTPVASEDTIDRYGRRLHFVNCVDRQAEIWSSSDGLTWQRSALISDSDQASETALVNLPDGRMIAFLRHDDHSSAPEISNRPEILTSKPPYRVWRVSCRLPFRSNGPSIGLVNDRVVTCSRAFFEDPRTPLSDSLSRARSRGLIIGIFDPDDGEWLPAITLPHHFGRRRDLGDDLGFPDVSYAWFTDRGKGRFALTYYQGFKGSPSDIRMARLKL
jgi:hypothetical protein